MSPKEGSTPLERGLLWVGDLEKRSHGPRPRTAPSLTPECQRPTTGGCRTVSGPLPYTPPGPLQEPLLLCRVLQLTFHRRSGSLDLPDTSSSTDLSEEVHFDDLVFILFPPVGTGSPVGISTIAPRADSSRDLRLDHTFRPPVPGERRK